MLSKTIFGMTYNSSRNLSSKVGLNYKNTLLMFVTCTYLQIIELSANVILIKAAIQRKCESNYVLMTRDGTELEDSPGTEGDMRPQQ